MKKYIGVKMIDAEPQYKPGMRHEDDPGNLKGDGYKVIYEGGHESWSPKDVFEKAYEEVKLNLPLGKIYKEYEDHQKRVLDEALELGKKIKSLDNFLKNGSSVNDIDLDEVFRLNQQLITMKYYLTILVERINNFK